MTARLDGLQVGRAVAALAVVAHHANLAAATFAGRSFPLLEDGWAGVDFFFVLSGFIIAYSAPGKVPTQFLWHRFRRVFLPYLPIGIGMALVYTAMPAVSLGDRSWSWISTLTLAPINPSPALSVAWTLQHEFLFYLLFGAAFALGRTREMLIVWTIAIGVAAAMHLDWLSLRPINLEFVFGVLTYDAWRHKRSPSPLLALLPLALWLALGATRETSVLFGASVAVALPLLLIPVRWPGWARYLGNASFSLYLAHGIAISLAARFLPSLPLLVIAGVAGGLAYFHGVERPLLSRIPKNLGLSRLRRDQAVRS